MKYKEETNTNESVVLNKDICANYTIQSINKGAGGEGKAMREREREREKEREREREREKIHIY